MQRKDTALYFTHVIAMRSGATIFAGHLYLEGHEPSITRVMMLKDGAWYFLYDLDDIVHATALLAATEDEPERLVFMGRRGLVRIHPSGQAAHDEYVPLPNAYLKHLQPIAGQLYVCGSQNQVHRRTGHGWERIDEGCHVPLTDQVTCALNAMDGFAHDDIYAAGDAGALWHWNGLQWQRLQSPACWALEVVHCLPDGTVVLAGAGGGVFVGNRHTGWRELAFPGTDLRGIERACLFDGVLYLCAQTMLLALRDGQLTRVDIPIDGHLAFYGAATGNGRLWTVGDDYVLCFDGQQWQRVASPE